MRVRRHRAPRCPASWKDPVALRDLWPDCPVRDLRALSRLSTVSELHAGQLLAVRGQRPREMLLLVEGEAIITCGTTLLATARAGAPVGEMALLLHQARNATVFMATDGAALVLTPTELHQLRWASPYFASLVRAFTESRARERCLG